MKTKLHCRVLVVLALSLLFSGCKKKLPFTRDFREAIENDKVASVKALIDAGVNVNARDDTGATPLTVAVASNARPETTNLLLRSGADPDWPDGQGEYALNIALERGEAENAILLLKSGADPNNTNHDGLAALAFVGPFLQSHSGVDAVSFLLTKGAKADGSSGAKALESAFSQRNTSAAKLLMGAGAHVESDYGAESLHQAVSSGNYEMVELLLNSGVNPNTTGSGESPNLFLAAFSGSCRYRDGKYAEIVQLLISKGANVNVWYAERSNTPVVAVARCIAQYGPTPQSLAITRALQTSPVAAPSAAATTAAAASQQVEPSQPPQ